MKIAIVGAGSTYTPELMEGLLEAESLGLKELALYDINQERLDVVGGLAKRMAAAKGEPFQILLTLDRLEAIKNADFVLTQIRVGGQQARHRDTVICLEEDLIGQETTGAVGFAKAMRTIPVLLEICADMREHAPNAFLINFTNPAGIVTEAILKHGGVKAIGLCNVPYGMRLAAARAYQVGVEDVDLDYVGLNHLSWVRRVMVRGMDRTAELVEKRAGRPTNIPGLNINGEFQKALGMNMNSYLNYFYVEDEMIGHLQAQDKTRAQVVTEIEEQLLQMYKDPKLDAKPKELEKRGGANYSTVAVSLLKDIHFNTGAKHIVNVRNNYCLPELPADAVIEVPAVVDAEGATPLVIGKLEPEIRGLIQHVKAYEELTVEAAVTKDYDRALLALAANPLVTSVNKAKRILDRFNEEHNLGLK